jgi:phosphomevalonate kinase
VLYTRGLFMGAPPLEIISRCALEAHRQWQGGRGSGYDILTSVNGGAGIFTGGAEPLWTPLRWPDIYRMWIIQGRRSVKSPDAVKKYRLWKDAAGEHSRTVLGEMKKNIAELARILQSGGKPDTRGFLEILHSLSLSGIGLGELIGVPARPVFPEGFHLPLYRPGALAAKCLGAGDETILLAAVPDGLSRAELSFIGTLEEQGLAVALNPETDGLRNDESE